MDSGYNLVIHLWEHGYSYQVKNLAKELRQALKDAPPAQNICNIAEGVLVLISRHLPRIKKNEGCDGIFVDDGS